MLAALLCQTSDPNVAHDGSDAEDRNSVLVRPSGIR